MKDPEKVIQGKKNRAAGKRFEVKVRADAEKSGFIISRWMNNLSDFPEENINLPPEEREDRTIIPAKQSRFRLTSTGFPDFIAFKELREVETLMGPSKMVEPYPYVIYGIEVKSNGYLTKEEKEKCRWYLDHGIFNKILVASKGKKRGEIDYVEFK